MDNRPDSLAAADDNVEIGEFFKMSNTSDALIRGSWSRFRGDDFDNIYKEPIKLIDSWEDRGPKILWRVNLGEGHAAPVIFNGRVYLLDYDEQEQADVLRCFLLQDGRELWRRWYKVQVKRNHGMSRTIPVVTERFVVTIGPRCHVMCTDSQNGEYIWGVDLVRQFQAQVPLWYTGQCPLIDDSLAVIAVGGSALMVGLGCESGRIVWQAPNPHGWKMSHSSIMPMTLDGKKMYVYCALGGLVGISASGKDRGQILWETTDWNHSVIAPSPIMLPDGVIFVTAGYGAGAMMFRVTKENGTYKIITLKKYGPAEGLACEQQSPILYKNHLFGILPKDAAANRSQFICCEARDPSKIVWNSGKTVRFGLGPFILADNKFFILSDDGVLTIARVSTERFTQLAQAKILNGFDAWGPMAIVNGFLLARDSRELVCVDLKAS